LLLKSYVTIESTDIEHPENYILTFDGHYGINDTMNHDDAFLKCLFHVVGKQKKCGVRGVTLQSKNTRYCFHPEDGGDGYEASWFLENCILDWLGNEYSSTGYWGFALGIGISAGASGYVKNVKWKNKDTQSGSALAGHNGHL
jgi:hypothetical protein